MKYINYSDNYNLEELRDLFYIIYVMESKVHIDIRKKSPKVAIKRITQKSCYINDCHAIYRIQVCTSKRWGDYQIVAITHQLWALKLTLMIYPKSFYHTLLFNICFMDLHYAFFFNRLLVLQVLAVSKLANTKVIPPGYITSTKV